MKCSCLPDTWAVDKRNVAELLETGVIAGGVWIGSRAMRLGLRLTICRVTVSNEIGDLYTLITVHDLRNVESSSLMPSGHYMYRTVVTVCTAQCSLYVPHSGHYMYRTVVIICTAQWSLYVAHCGHYMYRILVTIFTAQWSVYVPQSGHYMYPQWLLYVSHSGHHMYRTVVTICTAQWSLYVPHSGHYMYHTVVTICTAQYTTSVVNTRHLLRNHHNTGYFYISTCICYCRHFRNVQDYLKDKDKLMETF